MHLPGALLYHVAQLVGEQLPAATGPRIIDTALEKDILACGERPGAELLVEGIRLGTGVHPHGAEIVAQCLAHLRLAGVVQRTTAAAGMLDSSRHFWCNRAALESHSLYIWFPLESCIIFFFCNRLALNSSRLALHLNGFLFFLRQFLALNDGRCGPVHADCSQAVTQPGSALQLCGEIVPFCLAYRHGNCRRTWIAAIDGHQ